MRLYYVASFFLFAVMCALLAVNAWLVLADACPILRFLFAGAFAAFGLWALVMTIVAATTRYRS